MKNIFRAFLYLICIILLGGCSEKEETGGVRLIDGTKSNQTLFADETTSGSSGIRFTTDGPWTAEVIEASTKADGSSVSWITLDQYNGSKAGDYTITVTIRKNYTGKDRKAYIQINSGSTITIIVEQKAVTESGEIPIGIDKTHDGGEPYVKLESEELILPASPLGSFYVNFKSNLIEAPVVVIERPGEEEQEEDIVAIVGINMFSPDAEQQLELEVFPNIRDKERKVILKFLTHDDNLLASIVLKQESGATCQLLDKQAEVGGLTFNFRANAQARHLVYGLSDIRLQSDAAVELFLADRTKSKELSLAEGTEKFTLTFDGLLPATTYYLYVLPMHNSGDKMGAYLIEEATTAIQEGKHDLVLEVSANAANDFTVYLPFCDDALKGTIDWGDDTTEKVEGWNQKGAYHQYKVSSATTFEVRFTGVLTTLELIADIREARENTLLAVKQWGYTGLTKIALSGFSSLKSVATDMEGAFRGVKHFGEEPYGGSFTGTNIESIPEDFFKYAVNATSFDYTFGGCKNVKNIPAELFKNCTKATSFQRTFIECEQLKQISGDIFSSCRAVTNFSSTFALCTSLENIPVGLFAANTEVTSFEGTFSSCTNLKSIPANLFANCGKVLYFGMSWLRDSSHRGGLGVFQKCESLQVIPETLFAKCPLVTDLSYAFADCKSLVSLPGNLFKQNVKLQQVEGTFMNCETLKTIPSDVFDNNRKVMNVKMAFAQSRNLEGESPYTMIDGKKVHLYERDKYPTEFVSLQEYSRCFDQCTKLTDYDKIELVW